MKSCLHVFVWGGLLLFFSCSANKPQVKGATNSILSLQETLDKSGSSSPTVEQYQLIREDFLNNMNLLKEQKQKQANSSQKKIKTGIVVLGVVAGIGGTIASLVVDDKDTQSTIGQTSSAVAGVSGLVGLIPFGNNSQSAKSVVQYLSIELPQFEKHWPQQIEKPLSADDWIQFSQEAAKIQHIVNEFEK